MASAALASTEVRDGLWGRYREAYSVAAGIISFGKQGSHGDAAHFAISVPTIREAVIREQVRWRDRLLFDT